MGDKVQAKVGDARRPACRSCPARRAATTLAQARQLAPEIGYPILLKAAAGGGGRGMRLVSSADELDDAFATASAEADAAFGDGSLYVEKALVPARHVEIQVLADAHGRRAHPRRARVLDPAPPPEAGRGVAVACAHARDARGDGGRRRARLPRRPATRTRARSSSCSGQDGAFYFIELNARLQVEHPVTELVTGVDIVHEQLRIAAGEPLRHTGRAERSGHAIEIRINAEDPANDFAPSPGRIERIRMPGGPGVRVDTHVETGSVVPPTYDSLIAKLIVQDEDRPAAIARALRALGEFEVEGIATTRDFARAVLRSEAFASGEYDTSYVDGHAP